MTTIVTVGFGGTGANNANDALTALGAASAESANAAANTVRVSQNGASTLSAKQLNFVNTANVTISVTDAGDGNANVEIFSAAGGGGGGGGGAGGSLGLTRDSFVGDGSNTSFTLSVTPTNEDHCMVYVDRVLQRNNEYNVSSTTLTFTDAPESNSVIDVYTAAAAAAAASSVSLGLVIALS